jgi:hypothetical protein
MPDIIGMACEHVHWCDVKLKGKCILSIAFRSPTASASAWPLQTGVLLVSRARTVCNKCQQQVRYMVQ